MQPDSNDKLTPGSNQADNTPDRTFPRSVPESLVTTQPKPPKSKKKLIIVVVILLFLLAGGAVYWFLIRDKNQPAETTNTSQVEKEPEAETSTIPEGFVEYNNQEEEISFIYPEAWGDAQAVPGPEQEASHLSKGKEFVIKFSKNDRVTAGLRTSDRTHRDDLGHGGMVYAGESDLGMEKQNLAHFDTAQIYMDTDRQVAYVAECVEFCGIDSPYIRYTIKTSNTDSVYSSLQFLYYGDKFGSEFYSLDDKGNSNLDASKVTVDKIVKLFPKTDERFLELQTIADYIINQQ